MSEAAEQAVVVLSHRQVEAEWEDQHAEEAREEWDKRAPARARQRSQERAGLTLGARLDHALAALEAISSVSASPVARTSKSADDSDREPGPPKVARPEIDANLRVIAYHVADIERRLDEERGHIPVSNSARLGSADKDRIIWDGFPGVHADIVASAAPYLGGTGRTIMRSREREGARRGLRVRLVDGKVLGRVVDDPHDQDYSA